MISLGLTPDTKWAISENTLATVVRRFAGFGHFVAYQALVSFAGVQHQAGLLLYSEEDHAVMGACLRIASNKKVVLRMVLKFTIWWVWFCCCAPEQKIVE